MSKINYQELREAAEQATQDEWVAYILPGHNGIYPARTSEGRHCGFFIDWPGIDGQRNAGANARYIAAIPPKVALALLDEINALEETRINDVCRIAELTKQLESAKSKLNEQREYYEGVIADGSKRIAELEAEPVSQTYKLNELSGNSPVTPDGWISCSERMPPQDDWILIYSKHGEYMAGQVQGEYVELSDGTLSWLGNALFWMPLPEPLQEVK